MATVYTSAGEAKVVDLIDGTSATHLDSSNAWIAQGTGATTAAKGDTTLVTEASEARVNPSTVDQPTADKNRWIGTITADGTKTITEAGLFDADTSGNLIIRGDFAGIGVTSGDQIEFTFELEQT